MLDLFSGMGSVAEALASDTPVITNDFLRFTTAFARARFLNSDRTPIGEAMRRLLPAYLEHRSHLRNKFSRRLTAELRSVEEGAEGLRCWMNDAPHVGRSRHYRIVAATAGRTSGPDHYEMVTRYYSAGYFSTPQAIDLDAIRWAIDATPSVRPRSWLLAAWLEAASSVINAPGHSAQYLKPNGESSHARIARYWRRSAWESFATALESVRPVGTADWRENNLVRNSEAVALLRRLRSSDVGAVYADPPYTRDQYHRYYHVYESMYRYDFPEARGEGRTPPPESMRLSRFSRAGSVREAFESLFAAVSVPRLTTPPRPHNSPPSTMQPAWHQTASTERTRGSAYVPLCAP